jgi:heterodisulfide reductase subunit A-like polyferredoxin
VSGTTGAALVMGAGIAGMQTALDLAGSGFYVYLVEKSPSIGGVMAKLDKTFPTNDCAMCILSPKLVECGRHLNIETITNAEVLSIEGSPGRFRVRVLQHPRYVDLARCTGCGDCEKVCPVSLPNEYEGGLNRRKAIFRPFPQAYPNAFTIQKESRPACQVSCPAGVHAQGYVALLRDGKFNEAVNLVKRHNPLPGICGRVCHHPCEARCSRGVLDQPVAICQLKRFIADYETQHPDAGFLPVPAESRPEKVAIVGSGPAGLTAAHFLALDGYPVTVFEALPVAGGMLAVGIPPYRLPKDVLNTEIGAIERLGVEIRTNTALGRDFQLTDLWKAGYRAVFLALGAHRDQKLNLPGEEVQGVVSGVEFLRDHNLGRPVTVGENVVIIGGGNVAMDAGRTALRLGAGSVTILYRRSRQEMPAAPHEVEAALDEGIQIRFLAAPVAVLSQAGKVQALTCQAMELGAPDASGRRRPVPVPGSEYQLPADQVIAAIGQVPETDFLAQGDTKALVGRWNLLAADRDTLATALPGVFAGGDALTGPDTVIAAIAAGKRAAESIRRYLQGSDLRGDRDFSVPELSVGSIPLERAAESRQLMPELPVALRLDSFAEVELGFSQEQAVREASRCLDCGICAECLACERACKAQAIQHQLHEVERELTVGAVVLSPGFTPADPSSLYALGYSRYADVVTSVEFERILSASGPFQGHVVRPSDGKAPRRIAFIQCAGSRDAKEGVAYCSAVCCMYAIKEAVIAKEHAGSDLDISIFYMDMRAYGKDFERYYLRARDEHGIKFVRAKVYGVQEEAGGGLVLSFAGEDGTAARETFDLVVLSVGLLPNPDLVKLAEASGLALDGYGYPRPGGEVPTGTSRPGIFVSGAAAAPKDIPETVVEASAAACAAAQVLSPGRWQLVKEKQYPPERPVQNRRPRIGVFVCHCGINIGGIVRVPEVVEYARTLPNVVYAEENLYTCSQDTQDRIKALIAEHDLNRVVVASCSPRTHEPLFQETIREAGLNPYLFEMANIRDQCSWVHMHLPGPATDKSKDLLRMAVAKARLIEPLYRTPVPVKQSALVIGGGVSGLTAALGLARQGFPAFLVEREEQLGGNLRRLVSTLEGDDTAALLGRLEAEVRAHPLAQVYTGARVEAIEGFVGNFKTQLKLPGGESLQLEHGAVIVATGGSELTPTTFCYGQDPRVLTLTGLERVLAGEPGPAALEHTRSVVMIGCVGSRQPDRPYCSRVCCGQLVKNALAIKARYPGAEVVVLYRDIRTYGLHEDAYRKARDLGVTFIRYDDDHPPVLEPGPDAIHVLTYDPVLGGQVAIEAGLVALAAGVEPAAGAHQLAQKLKVPLNADGFFLESHVKLRPVDFATDGVFVAGLCHAPKTVRESMAQAMAAVGRATTVISRSAIDAGGPVAEVNQSRCAGCQTCEEICQYQAIKVDPAKRRAYVEAAVCKGCGACAAGCRCGAITLKGFTDQQIMAEVVALSWN